MSIKDGDILKFLDGNASKKQANYVNEWIASDMANSKEMLRLGKMWKELGNYNSVKIPDVDKAWKSVKSQLGPIPTSTVHTDYKPKTSKRTSNLDAKPIVVPLVEKPSVAKPSTVEVQVRQPAKPMMAAVQDKTVVKKPSVNIGKVAVSDVNSPISKIEYDTSNSTSFVDNWVYSVFGIALLGILLYFAYTLYQNHTRYTEIKTQSEEQIIALEDGSSVKLLPFSELVYPKKMDQDSRSFMLTGDAVFDVVPDVAPFVVQYNGVSVRTLGTEFTLSSEGKAVLTSCLDGKIRFYETKNVENGVIVNQGSTYKYEDGIFADVTPDPEVEEAPLVFIREETGVKLLNLLDIIMEKSDWKVSSVPSMPFSPEYEVNIDIEADHMDIMNELNSIIDFDYRKASCSGCYLITKMKAPN